MKKLKEQRGAALVVGLVLLLVATTLGVAALTSTVTEERIAGNQKQISEAFMAAETGIARAVEWLETEVNGTPNHSNTTFWNQSPDSAAIATQIHALGQQVYGNDPRAEWAVEILPGPNPKDEIFIRSTGTMVTGVGRVVEVLYARLGGGINPPPPAAAYQCYGLWCSTRTGSNSNSAIYYDGREWDLPASSSCTGAGCNGSLTGNPGVAGIYLAGNITAGAISTGNQSGDSRPGQIQGNPPRVQSDAIKTGTDPADEEFVTVTQQTEPDGTVRTVESTAADWDAYIDALFSAFPPQVIDARTTTNIPASALGSRQDPTVLHVTAPSDGGWSYESIRATGNTHGAGIMVIDGDIDFTTAAGTSTFEGLIILRNGAKLTGGRGTFNVFGSIVSLEGNYYTDDARDIDITDADLGGNFMLKHSKTALQNLPNAGPGGTQSGVLAWREVVN
jgi:hypothetical protein